MVDQNSLTGVIAGVVDKLIDDLYLTIETYDPVSFRRISPKSATRDKKYLYRCLESEGIRFLTVRLPLLGKAFDSMLEQGIYFTKVDGFKYIGDSFVPVFLGPVFDMIQRRVYEAHQRKISHSEAAPVAKVITVLRSVLYCAYKLDVPFTDVQEAEKLRAFVDCDLMLPDVDSPYPQSFRGARICDLAEPVIEAVFDGVSNDTFEYITPRHGPGAVATGEKAEQKWEFSHFYESLHQGWPYYKYMYGIRSNGKPLQLLDNIKKYKEMTRLPYPVAKLVFVPKDSRGPRIISAEPLELQYIQQGVARWMMHHLAHHHLTRGRINFVDQSVNASLALDSSRTGEWATLDLSDASDRLSCALFKRLWPKRLYRKFMALRSFATTLPSGEEFLLRKFAPMGSAICFPVESLIFWAISVAALRASGVAFGLAAQSVYVYGDDIIVPSIYALCVMDALESVDLKVNRSKSFHDGHFRESCGCDAWFGYRITPVRIKKFPGRRPSDGVAHAAWLAYASRFLEIGCGHAAMYCREVVSDVLGYIPFTSQQTGYLSVVFPEREEGEMPIPTRWNADLQVPEAKLWTLRAKRRPTTLESWDRLNRDLVDPDPINPDSVVVREATIIRKRWCDISTA